MVLGPLTELRKDRRRGTTLAGSDRYLATSCSLGAPGISCN